MQHNKCNSYLEFCNSFVLCDIPLSLSRFLAPLILYLIRISWHFHFSSSRSGEPKLPCDPAPVLQKYQMEAVSDTATRSTVIVSRRHVLKSAFSALERKTFSMNGTLYVKFSGEIGEDHGGPRREFLRCVEFCSIIVTIP